MRKLTTEEFIKRARKVHGDKYDYSKVEYVNAKTKVIIICPDHGKFDQRSGNHSSGFGCNKCAHELDIKRKTMSLDDVNSECEDYKSIKLFSKSGRTWVTSICTTHGEFTQVLSSRLKGLGCKKCAIDKTSKLKRSNTSSWIEKARRVHGDKYDYSKVEYETSRSKVKIICPEHGEFRQAPGHHIQCCNCPKCANTGQPSKQENEIANHIESMGINIIRTEKQILEGKHLDIFIPDHNIAIEYNGLYWHSEQFGRGRYDHKFKTDLCKNAGVRLIHIWEDDFVNNKELELNFLTNILGKSTERRYYARKSEPSFITYEEAKAFLNAIHVQGSVSATYHVGLRIKGDLKAVASFTKRKDKFELVRYAGKNVIGGLGKACKFFSRLISSNIYTFCDNARFSGESYLKAGFKAVSELKPDYKYVVKGQRRHKFGFRRKFIKRNHPEVYSEDKTELEMMTELGIYRIWDCGKTRYEYKRN